MFMNLFIVVQLLAEMHFTVGAFITLAEVMLVHCFVELYGKKRPQLQQQQQQQLTSSPPPPPLLLLISSAKSLVQWHIKGVRCSTLDPQVLGLTICGKYVLCSTFHYELKQRIGTL